MILREMTREALALSVPEARKLLGLSRPAAYRAVRRGDLPTILMNGRMLVPRHCLEALLNGEPSRPFDLVRPHRSPVRCSQDGEHHG